MKKLKWIIGLLVIAAAITIWFWKFKKSETAIELEIIHPEYGTISNSVTATGMIQPVDTVAVGTQVSGTIEKVYVDFNSQVRKGQLLAELDKSVLLAQVQQISANLQSAKANLAYQQSNYDRQNQLFNVGAISKATLETALYQFESSKQSVSSLSAQLSSAQRNLSYAEIYSPIDGTVLSRGVSEGQTVASSFSTPTLFSIAKDLTKMQVQASVNEADIGNVKAGQRVDFTVDAFPSDTFSGIVKEVRLRPSVSSNVVSYTTIIDAPNPSLKLKPGMTASITIYTKEIKDVLLLAAKATTFNPDSIVGKQYIIEKIKQHDEAPSASADSSLAEATPAFVWIKRDNSLVQKKIWIGIDDETSLQVVGGLSPKDEVVSGYQKLEKAAAKKSTEKSPFLPQRPGGNNKKNNQGPPPQ